MTVSLPGLFDDIAGNPLLNFGAGLLSAAGQPNFGVALGQGLQFASAAQQHQARNDLLRTKLANEAKQQAAVDRQQAAVERLQGLLGPDPNAPIPLTPEGQAAAQQQQIMGLLAQAAPEQFTQAILAQALPKPQQPTNLEREFNFLTGIGVPRDRALEALQNGTVVNVGGDPEEPLSVSDLAKVRLPDGSTPPIGTTPSQARAMGAAVVTTSEIDKANSADNALAILDQIETLAIGPEGVLTDVEPGVLSLGAAALSDTLNLLTQHDPAVSQLQSLSQGAGSTIVRAMGEKGALSDGDVQRALGLLPQVGNLAQLRLPDTRETATAKLKDLREILERGQRNLESGKVVTPRTPTPKSADEPKRLRFNPETGLLE